MNFERLNPFAPDWYDASRHAGPRPAPKLEPDPTPEALNIALSLQVVRLEEGGYALTRKTWKTREEAEAAMMLLMVAACEEAALRKENCSLRGIVKRLAGKYLRLHLKHTGKEQSTDRDEYVTMYDQLLAKIGLPAPSNPPKL